MNQPERRFRVSSGRRTEVRPATEDVDRFVEPRAGRRARQDCIASSRREQILSLPPFLLISRAVSQIDCVIAGVAGIHAPPPVFPWLQEGWSDDTQTGGQQPTIRSPRAVPRKPKLPLKSGIPT